MSRRRIYDVMVAASTITQLGLSVAVPIVLCILLAGWLKNKFQLGNYVTVIGIIIGVGSGCCSFINFARLMNKTTNRRD